MGYGYLKKQICMHLNSKATGTEDDVLALRSLFEQSLREMYWSEMQLATAFENILASVSSKDTVRMLTLHAVTTKMHCDRIEKIFESIGLPPQHQRFEPMESLIGDMMAKIALTEFGSVRDAAVIACVQLITHCEIAAYGTLKSFALSLKEEDVVALLEKNLADEKEIDLKLTVVAEAYINDEAANKEF